MKKIVRVGIPALVSIILLVLYFILEKNEKITTNHDAKQCLDKNRSTLEKGDTCYIYKNGTCYKGNTDANSKQITKDSEIYNGFYLASLAVHCVPQDVYYKYDLLLWFGIFFAVVAITMNFIDLKI